MPLAGQPGTSEEGGGGKTGFLSRQQAEPRSRGPSCYKALGEGGQLPLPQSSAQSTQVAHGKSNKKKRMGIHSPEVCMVWAFVTAGKAGVSSWVGLPLGGQGDGPERHHPLRAGLRQTPASAHV